MNGLLERYNLPAPRYTSYPSAPHWGAAGGDLLAGALSRSSRPLSLYIHLPFCEKLCLYCGCNVVISKDHDVATPYIDHLIAEMDLLKTTRGRVVTQLHWGGGTPTFLTENQIERLFDAIVTRFAIPATAEISIEIDPRVTTVEHLRKLRSLGFNRLSMGIQDFDNKVQEAVRRIQPFEMVRRLFDEARALKFESINADLIYGLPFQDRFSFGITLDKILALEPDRIAAFSYAHVPSIKHQQKALDGNLPAEEQKLGLLIGIIDRLVGAGYVQIGMDHFARAGDPLATALGSETLHRNFQGYTTQAETDLLGLGVTAISHVGDVYTQNERDLAAYERRVQAGQTPVVRGYALNKDDRIRADIIEKILCHGIVSKKDVEERFGIRFDAYFLAEIKALDQFRSDGLILSPWLPQIRVTTSGRLFIRTIAQVFDAFAPAAVASQTV